MELETRSREVPPVTAVVAAVVLAAACVVLALQVHGAGRAAVGLAGPLVALAAHLIGQVLRLDNRLAATNRELVRATHELTELARRDPVTGLLNRDAFEEMAAHQVGRIDGEHRSLVYVAVDGVERHGRGAAAEVDGVLVAVADALRRNVRPDDAVSRIGPASFAVLLRHSDTATATGVVERLAERLEGVVEVSAGVATTNGPVVLDALLSEAAEQLVAARRDGAHLRSAFVRPSPVPLLPSFAPAG